MFPLTCLFFHKTHNQNLQKSLVNPLLTEVFSTAERQFQRATLYNSHTKWHKEAIFRQEGLTPPLC